MLNGLASPRRLEYAFDDQQLREESKFVAVEAIGEGSRPGEIGFG